MSSCQHLHSSIIADTYWYCEDCKVSVDLRSSNPKIQQPEQPGQQYPETSKIQQQKPVKCKWFNIPPNLQLKILGEANEALQHEEYHSLWEAVKATAILYGYDIAFH